MAKNQTKGPERERGVVWSTDDQPAGSGGYYHATDDYDSAAESGMVEWLGRAMAGSVPRGRVLHFLVGELVAYALGLCVLATVDVCGVQHAVLRQRWQAAQQSEFLAATGEGWVLSTSQLVFLTVAACFVAVCTADFHGIITSQNPLKSHLLCIVLCVNVQASLTYWILCLDYFPVCEDAGGRPVYPVRYLLWGCSTTALIFLLDEVAHDPRTWLLATVVTSDVATIALGFLSSNVSHESLRWFLFVVAVFAFLPAVWGMWTFFSKGAEKLISRQSMYYHRLLGYLSLFIWSSFPFVYVLASLNMISVDLEVIIYSILDVSAKTAYSVCIVRNNCYSMYQLEELKSVEKEEVISRPRVTMNELQLAHRILMAARSEAGSTKHMHRSFLMHVSHELRTPLNSVIGYNELLSEDPELNALQRSYVNGALNSARSLLGMIDNILEYSRMENTITSLQPQEFAIFDVVDYAIDSLRKKALHQGVDVICSCNVKDIPLLIGDSHRLGQILVHLLENAIKSYRDERRQNEEAIEIRILIASTEHEEMNVSLEYWKVDKPIKAITLDVEIEDHGCGIPADQFSKLFTPFGQVEPVEQRAGIGISYPLVFPLPVRLIRVTEGLGLAIVKKLVEAMGGRVACTSVVGVGSVFSIRDLIFPISNCVHQQPLTGEKLAVIFVAGPELLPSISYHLKSLNVHLETVDASTDQLNEWYTANARSTFANGDRERTSYTHLRHLHRSKLQEKKSEELTRATDQSLLIIDAQLLTEVEIAHLPYSRIIVLAPTSRQKDIQRQNTASNQTIDVITRPVTKRVLSEVIFKAQPQTIGRAGKDKTKTDLCARSTDKSSLTVLVVDDNKINQKVVSAVLRRLDVPYHIANDGVEAIQCFCEGKYDLILMDLTMPRMGGIEATRIIRKMEANTNAAPIAIVAMTAATSTEDEELCMKSGFTHYLPKPVKFASVKGLIDKKADRLIEQRIESGEK